METQINQRRGLLILLFFTFFMVVGFDMIMPLVIGHYVNNVCVIPADSIRLYCRTRFSGSLNAESDARPCRVGGGTHYDVIPWWSNVYRLYESDVCRYVCIHGNFGG